MKMEGTMKGIVSRWRWQHARLRTIAAAGRQRGEEGGALKIIVMRIVIIPHKSSRSKKDKKAAQ